MSEFQFVVRRVARRLVVLQLTSEPFIEEELGRVSREPVNLEPRVLLEEGLYDLRSVVRSAVPQHHDWSSMDVVEQMVEERDHLGSSDRSLADQG